MRHFIAMETTNTEAVATLNIQNINCAKHIAVLSEWVRVMTKNTLTLHVDKEYNLVVYYDKPNPEYTVVIKEGQIFINKITSTVEIKPLIQLEK